MKTMRGRAKYLLGREAETAMTDEQREVEAFEVATDLAEELEGEGHCPVAVAAALLATVIAGGNAVAAIQSLSPVAIAAKQRQSAYECVRGRLFDIVNHAGGLIGGLK
jgi:hypothetical protein